MFVAEAMFSCPCCGAAVRTIPVKALNDARLSACQRTVLRQLVDAYPRSVSPEALMGNLYSGSRYPDFARGALTEKIRKVRRKIAEYGWTIPQGAGGKGNRAEYRLEPILRTSEATR